MVLNYKMSKVKKSFKVIIAGSRSFQIIAFRRKCNKILTSISDEIWIISGCAKGTDLLGEKYAKNKDIISWSVLLRGMTSKINHKIK